MDELITLGLGNLEKLPGAISVPTYQRSQVTAGIVHIGVGNFHRAHQAWYLHRLMQQGSALDWGIVGAGVRAPYDELMRQKLRKQDYLTTLIELDSAGISAEIIGSLIDYLPVEDGNGSLIAKMADPAIRIVSLTVTEGGYFIDPVSGGFDAEHAEIGSDVQKPDHPNTAFGAIIAALKIRRTQGYGPFTILSCDNLIGNGAVAKQTIVSLAKLADPDLANWIADNCCFPSSMVDCIVPATGDKELVLAQEFGVMDQVPVTHESFRQWVIEDNFCAGRPAWEKVGATFTDNVHDYEIMKLRLLNAGHQILANAGEVLSLNTIAECMQDDKISALFRKVQLEEIAPIVASVPDMEPQQYVRLIEKRFRNEAIVDTTRRVAFDGSSRHTGFVLPTIRERLDAGLSVEGLALVEALWARMCEGTREDGSKIEPNDPHWDQLAVAAGVARQKPGAWLEQHQYYGDLFENAEFSNAFESWLTLIWSDGTRAALHRYIDGEEAFMENRVVN